MREKLGASILVEENPDHSRFFFQLISFLSVFLFLIASHLLKQDLNLNNENFF